MFRYICHDVLSSSFKSNGPSVATAWRRVAQDLADEILASRYPVAEPLPGEHQLCRRFQVSRITVRRALDDLERKGLVRREHGRGTFAVARDHIVLPPLALVIVEPHKVSNSFFTELISGANGYLEAFASQVSVVTQPPRDWPAAFARRFAGAMVVPPALASEDIEQLRRYGVGCVQVFESDFDGPAVVVDIESAAYDLTQMLLALGHRRLAMITGHDHHADRRKRAGVTRALLEAELDPAGIPDWQTNYDPDEVRQASEQLFARRSKPTAVITFDDMLALQAIAAAQRHGLTVPGDVSVVGFNDAPFSALMDPALSTVRLPMLEAGRRMAQILCEHHLKNTPLSDIRLSYEILWRASTGRRRRAK